MAFVVFPVAVHSIDGVQHVGMHACHMTTVCTWVHAINIWQLIGVAWDLASSELGQICRLAMYDCISLHCLMLGNTWMKIINE